jgi:hypothetical protein
MQIIIRLLKFLLIPYEIILDLHFFTSYKIIENIENYYNGIKYVIRKIRPP